MADKMKVLFLTSTPRDYTKLSDGPEFRDITAEIRASLDRNAFDIAAAPAVQVADLQRELLEHDPGILHFSGHGSATDGILLEDDMRRPAPVDGKMLADLFAILNGRIQIVFLNACATSQMGDAIQQVVDYTIGMQGEISDQAAISFAKAFYRGIGARKTPDVAFRLGIHQLVLERLPDADVPRLFMRAPGAPTAIEVAGQHQPQNPIQTLVHAYDSHIGTIIAFNGTGTIYR